MGVFKRRTEFINAAYAVEKDAKVKKLLGVGYVPEHMLADYAEFMKGENSDPDTDFDRISNQNFFALNAGKVAGVTVPGTGHLNAVVVKGTLTDVLSIIDSTLTGQAAPEIKSEIETTKQFLTDSEQIIEALSEMAAKAKSADLFYNTLALGSAENWNVDINSDATINALGLVKGDTSGNEKKIKAFYNTKGLAAKKQRKAAADQAKAEMAVDAITEMAEKANQDIEKQIEAGDFNAKQNDFYQRAKAVFSSLKINDQGIYIPSTSNSHDYIVKKAKEAGLDIHIVNSENDLTDLYNLYIAEGPKPKVYDLLYTNAGGVTVVSNKADTEKKTGDYKTVAHINEFGRIEFFDKKLPANIVSEIEKFRDTEQSQKSINKEILEAGQKSGRIIIGRMQNPSTQSTMSKTNTGPEIDISTNDLQVISKLNLIDDKPTGKKTQTISETVRLYNPGINEAEIKAWVFYRRKFGNPMKGWEKYFMTGGTSASILLQTNKDTVVKDNKYADLRTVPANTILGAKTKFRNTYGSDTLVICKTITNELIWVNVADVKEIKNAATENQKEIDALVQAKALIFDGNEYYPYPVFLFGDIYEKLKNLNANRDAIVAKYGEAFFDEQLILVRSYLPKLKTFRDPVKSNRPNILCLSEFANNVTQFGVLELNEETGVRLGVTRRNRFEALEEKVSLFEAFKTWLNEFVKDIDLKNTTKADIEKYYFAKSIRWPKNAFERDVYSQAQKDELVGNARLAAEELFSEFLATSLTFEDSVALDGIWNEKYNAFTNIIQFVDKVPVAFDGSTMFKNGELGVKPAQRQGLAYLQLTGSGCLAYDVGFGKTLTGILNLAQLVSQGAVKRPLVVVPKPTYKNWLKELFGYWTDGERVEFESFPNAIYHYGVFSGTGIKMNDWYNLSGKHYQQLLKDNDGNINKLIPENTITIVSYKGFEQMGFSSAVSEQMFDSIARVLMQKDANEPVKSAKKDQAEKVSFYQKMQGWLGVGNKNAVVNVDVCGFDHLTVDEAHNFKNVFAACGKDEATGRKLFGISGGQSSRAIKMFFITNYVQAKHGKNVVLLTATPFSNSPLEIYSMLSFVGLETLNQYNLFNIKKFFEQFVLETIEYAVDAKGEIITKPVIKSFENIKLLQTILYNHFHYKDDPREANVVRPCKIELPNQDINTYLDMNDWQKENQAAVKDMAKTVSRENPGAMLRAINMSLNNAFSPYLFAGELPPSAYDFVENSPKIKFAVECIKSVKQWHENRGETCSGQVIYSNRGRNYFEYIKQYLIEEIGFKDKIAYDEEIISEVEIIAGGGGEGDEDRKELIKDAFNAGIVKVIIGTSTIREGINLQTRGSSIFNLYPEWNPTDVHQLKGRIWRQGNMFGYIRFVTPLVINSMDNFINQKVDEKSKRISSLWKPIGDLNSMENTSDLDPSEIKYALVDDANEKFKMKHDQAKNELARTVKVLTENIKILEGIESDVESLKYYEDALFVDLMQKKSTYAEYLTYLKTLRPNVMKKAEIPDRGIKDVELVINNLAELLENINKYEANRYNLDLLLFTLRLIKGARKYKPELGSSDYAYQIQGAINNILTYGTFKLTEYNYERFVSFYSDIKKAEKSVLNAYNKSWQDDISDIMADVQQRLAETETYDEKINSEEFKDQQIREIAAEMEQARSVRGDLMEQVERFASLNHTLSYLSDNTDKEACDIPTQVCCETNGITVVHVDKEVKTPVAVIEPGEPDLTKPIEFSKKALVFVPAVQVKVSKSFEYNDAKLRINKAASEIPGYDQNPDKIVYFHYFNSGSDYFMLETDFTDDYQNVFGYGILNGDYQNAELGSSALADLKKYYEIDFYFEPKPLKQALGDAGNPKYAEFKTKMDEPVTLTKKDYQDSLAGAKVMYSLATGKEKKDWKAYIDGLKVMIDLMPDTLKTGGSVDNDQVFTKTTYSVYLDHPNWTEPILATDNLEKAQKEFDQYSIGDVERQYQTSRLLSIRLEKYVATYKFVHQLDEDETVDDFPLEDYAQDSDYYELISDDYDQIENRSIPAINLVTDEILQDVQSHFGGKYTIIDLDEDGNEQLTLRIADHSGKWRNKPSFGKFLSIVIAEKDPTGHFKTDGPEGLSSTDEFSFDSDSNADEIIEFINKKIQEFKDEL